MSDGYFEAFYSASSSVTGIAYSLLNISGNRFDIVATIPSIIQGKLLTCVQTAQVGNAYGTILYQGFSNTACTLDVMSNATGTQTVRHRISCFGKL